MIEVEIDAGGRKVTVKCPDTGISAKEILAEVRAAWKDTDGAVRATEGPAFGMQLAQRAGQVSPMHMGAGGGRTGYVLEPRAEDG